jgi:type II secretory pathway pseudopilin PulG
MGAPDAGVSIAELAVAIMILGIVTALVAGFYSSTIKTIGVASALRTNTAMASNAMNELSRVIRAGTENPLRDRELPDPAFVSATAESLVIYAYVNLQSSDQNPVMIRFRIDGDRRLIEEKWAATKDSHGYWRFPSLSARPEPLPTTRRVVASALAPVAPGVPALFSYVDVSGAVIPLPAAGLSVAAIRTVAAVSLTVSIQGSASDAGSRVMLENTVGIPNLGLNRRLG